MLFLLLIPEESSQEHLATSPRSPKKLPTKTCVANLDMPVMSNHCMKFTAALAMELLIVSGRSGSGKTIALRVLEVQTFIVLTITLSFCFN